MERRDWSVKFELGTGTSDTKTTVILSEKLKEVSEFKYLGSMVSPD